MWLAIGKFFSAVVKFILGLLTSILEWARKHPREAVIVSLSVFLLIASNIWTHKWTTDTVKKEDAKVIAALQGQVKAANDETAKRDEKIKLLEKQSKAVADETERALTEAQLKAAGIISEYEKKLREERKNYRVIYVKDKEGKETPINIDNQGSVICDKFSQTFMDSVNRLVDNANAPLGLRMSTTIRK